MQAEVFSKINNYFHAASQQASVKSPTVAIKEMLLCEYDIGAVPLDVYGEQDCNGYYVYRVALRGTSIDLTDLLSNEQMRKIEVYCNAELPCWEEVQEDLRTEARAHY